MGYWKAITTDGVRVYFKVVRNGNLRTGLLAGVFTVLLINMDDNDSTALTVNESTEKPGVYYVDIPTSFITTYGAGFYGLSIGVHAVGPTTDDEVLYSVEVTTLDLNNVVTDTANAVWDEQKAGHVTANSYGKIVQDLETLIKQVKALTAAQL